MEVPAIPAVTPCNLHFVFHASAGKDVRPQNVLQNATSAELAFLKPGFAVASAQLREGFVPPAPASVLPLGCGDTYPPLQLMSFT